MGRCAAGCILKMSSYLIYLDHQNAGGNRDMINILPSAFDDGLKIRMVNPMEIFAAKGNAFITRAVAESSFLFYFLTYNASGITIYLTIRLNVK